MPCGHSSVVVHRLMGADMARKPGPPSHQHQPPTTISNPPLHQQQQQIVSTTFEYSGPLPPPAMLRQYNEIYPGMAKQIIDLAERQADHRMHLEKTVVVNDARRANWGLVCATLITIAFLGVSSYLILNEHDIAGSILGVIDLGALVGVFIYGTNSRKQERTEKARRMPSELKPQ